VELNAQASLFAIHSEIVMTHPQAKPIFALVATVACAEKNKYTRKEISKCNGTLKEQINQHEHYAH